MCSLRRHLMNMQNDRMDLGRKMGSRHLAESACVPTFQIRDCFVSFESFPYFLIISWSFPLFRSTNFPFQFYASVNEINFKLFFYIFQMADRRRLCLIRLHQEYRSSVMVWTPTLLTQYVKLLPIMKNVIDVFEIVW
jgi:hypothetical protein